MTCYLKKFPILIFLIILILISGCGPSQDDLEATAVAQTAAAVTPKPTTLDKLKALEPTYQVYFDGETCTVEGPPAIKTGEYLIILHNQVDVPSTLWLGSHFGDGSFEDHYQWFEDNCGGQGTRCEDEEGSLISYAYAAWGNAKQQAKEGIETYYKVYDINMEREYFILVSMDSYWEYLCAPIQVSN